MPYATQSEINLAEELGYVVEVSQHYGHRFHLDQRRVWSSYESPTGIQWMTADIVEGRFANHQRFPVLGAALRRPLTEKESCPSS